MINVILVAILAAIIGGAVIYIYKAKKHGVRCIGCPGAKACAGRCEEGGGCEGCGGCTGA